MYRAGVVAAGVGTNYFELAGHPIRWRLLVELAASDAKVRELSRRLSRKQGLVSYHLGRLRAARLVSMRRSSADGRDAYYTLDVGRCGELLAATGQSLHPALQLRIEHPVVARRERPVRVLFLCTGNSARSQMAEALVGEMSGGAIVACSAGGQPKQLHPNAVRAMREHGIDISGRRAKSLDLYREAEFDYVVTLCDRVREVCPEFHGHPRTIHWSLPDPAAAASSDDESYPAFEQTAAELTRRIGFFLAQIASAPVHEEREYA